MMEQHLYNCVRPALAPIQAPIPGMKTRKERRAAAKRERQDWLTSDYNGYGEYHRAKQKVEVDLVEQQLKRMHAYCIKNDPCNCSATQLTMNELVWSSFKGSDAYSKFFTVGDPQGIDDPKGTLLIDGVDVHVYVVFNEGADS